MSQEDKPVSTTFRNGIPRLAVCHCGMQMVEGKTCSVCGYKCEEPQPVAAQEPVAKVLGVLMTSGRSDEYSMEFYKPLEVGALLYANAVPCARCEPVRLANIDCVEHFNALKEDYNAAKDKITEQAAEIERLDDEVRLLQKVTGEDQAEITEQADRIQALEAEAADRESFIKTLADTCTEAERIAIERAGRIDVLEAENGVLRAKYEAFSDQQHTIDRQRKVIESAKTALE